MLSGAECVLQEVRALKKEQAQVDAMGDGPDKDFHRQRLINELYRASGEAKTGEVLKHIISLQEAGKIPMIMCSKDVVAAQTHSRSLESRTASSSGVQK